MGLFLSCFETCAHNMTLLERIAYRKGERGAYMDTIAVVIHGYEPVETTEMIHEAPPQNEKRVRFRRFSMANHDSVYDAEDEGEVEGEVEGK